MGTPRSTTGMLEASEPLFKEKEGEMNMLILHTYFSTLTQLSTTLNFTNHFSEIKAFKSLFPFYYFFSFGG